MPRTEAEYECAKAMWRSGRKDQVFIGATSYVDDDRWDAADGDCGPVPLKKSWWFVGIPVVLPREPSNWFGNDEDCAILMNGAAWGSGRCEFTMPSICQLRDCFEPHCP